MSTTLTESQPSVRHPSFGEALRFWLKLGFVSFGGPSGQIAMMHTELVEKKRWIDNARFLHALNFCMLPGSSMQKLCPVSARAELLHAASWPGSAATRHL